MSARAMQLREGIAPTRDRLTTTVFMAALVHGVIIVGVTFGGVNHDKTGAPGLEVLHRLRRRARGAQQRRPPPISRNARSSARATPSIRARSAQPARRRRTRRAQRPRRRHRARRRRRRAARDRRQPRANYLGADARDPVLRAARQPHRDARGAGARPRATASATSSASTTPRTRRCAARSATNCG